MMAFIEESRGSFGVEPICKVLLIAPSTYYDRVAIARDPDRASARAKSAASMCIEIDRVWDENRRVYGARKVWHALRREGQDVARCTVERLMGFLGIQGVVRGRRVVTTNPDTSQPCPDDKVNRQFTAERPNQLWVSDFTYVPTWSGVRHWARTNGASQWHLNGSLYVAPRHGHSDQWRSHGSIIDVFARPSAGAPPRRWPPSSFWMLWNRRSGKGNCPQTRA